MANHWFKNAVIYCIDVDTFKEGIGDFIGLRQGLSYLAGLGVTCIWLIPFYPSAGRDNGSGSVVSDEMKPTTAILAGPMNHYESVAFYNKAEGPLGSR